MPSAMPCMPGIISTSLLTEPSLVTFSRCEYMSRIVKAPSWKRVYSSLFVSMLASLSDCMRPETSPKPSIFDTNDVGLNISNSSKCSPVPMKTTGEPVAATAERAPPPLAFWLSSFVMMTEPTLTLPLNSLACSCSAWPLVASMTYTMSCGLTASSTCFISSKSAASCLWRPDVSTMMTSYFSFLSSSTPSRAMTTGSDSAMLP
mmetsp:Transcript_2322/g.7220  ORF Transcript_2322/g.7220 Transcript_2322/m.7220 type:complete len:204 (-) Transcript_2322:647-1258(-)